MSSIAARENIESNRVSDVDWWRQALVYQIYPRSFTDSDGDGLGDLKGVTLKVEYLKALGINAIWLSPFYPSALADGGYDVDNYRDVDPRLGTLDDFDELVATTPTLSVSKWSWISFPQPFLEPSRVVQGSAGIPERLLRTRPLHLP